MLTSSNLEEKTSNKNSPDGQPSNLRRMPIYLNCELAAAASPKIKR